MKKAIQGAVVAAVMALGFAASAADQAKPVEQKKAQKQVKLTAEQMKKISAGSTLKDNFCCGHSFHNHDNGDGNDPGHHH